MIWRTDSVGRRPSMSSLTPTVQACSAEPFCRAGDGGASSLHDAAAAAAAHGNLGSRRSFRRCRTLLSCTAPNSCNNRTWHHLNHYRHRVRSRTMNAHYLSLSLSSFLLASHIILFLKRRNECPARTLGPLITAAAARASRLPMRYSELAARA